MREEFLLKKAVAFSLMGVLTASPVLIAHANPGAAFSSETSGGTQDTPDAPNTPDVSDAPDMPDAPDVPDVPDIPDIPSNSGSPSDGGSSSGGTVTVSSSGVSSALDSVMAKGVKMFTTVAGRYSTDSVTGVTMMVPYSDVVATVGTGTDRKPFTVIENSVCGEGSRACMVKKLEELKPALPKIVSGPALDIWLGISDINNNFTKVGKAARPIEFKIGIPANLKTDGYDYTLVLVQSDDTTPVIIDTDDDGDTMTFSADVYGTFTLVKGSSGSLIVYR